MKKYLQIEHFICFSIVATMITFVFWPFLSGSFGLVHPASAQASSTSAQTINLTVNQTLTLTLSTSTLNLPALTPGAPVSATSSATVATNAATGWSLKISRNSATSTMASGTITFPDATAWNGSNNSTSSATIGTNLHFRVFQTGTTAGLYSTSYWGSNDTDPNAFYAGFPTTAQTVASTSTYVGSNQIVVLKVRADSPATQQATNYSGAVTITAIANP
jgi:hypothetical protein